MRRFKRFLKSKFSIDTLAYAIFSICSSTGLTFFYEILVAGMTDGQWIKLRILYNVLKFSGARFCGEITDWVRLKMLETSENKIRKAVADTISLSIYQIPIYIISGLIMKVDINQLLVISIIYILDNVMLGWSYGIFLDWARKKFKNPVIQ